MPEREVLDRTCDVVSNASQPLYEQIASAIADDIKARRWEPGHRLPGERRLAEHYKVSRVTLRAALGRLQRLGKVEASASRGWFAATPEPPHTTGVSIEGFGDFAAAIGLRATATVLSQTVRSATIDEAERLMIAPGADLFELRRLRFLDDQLVAIELNQLPLAVCPELAETDFTHASLYATLRAATPPVAPYAADYSVGARAPLPEEARLLEIHDSTPVLEAQQIAHHGPGRPVEYSVVVYRADRYRFRASQAFGAR